MNMDKKNEMLDDEVLDNVAGGTETTVTAGGREYKLEITPELEQVMRDSEQYQSAAQKERQRIAKKESADNFWRLDRSSY